MATFLIAYDVSSTKLRNRVVKELKAAGCMRVQLSVWLLVGHQRKYAKQVESKLQHVWSKSGTKDTLLVIQISGQQLTDALQLGGRLPLASLADARIPVII